MKNILYILVLLFIVSCKNETMKSVSADMEVSTDAVESTVNSNALQDISTQKLNEYFELIQLKQLHPEFESDINAQLLSFTNGHKSFKNYEEGFMVSNIQHSGKSKTLSDSVEVFTLKYTVTTHSKIFKDSIKTYVTSGTDYLESVEVVTIKKVRFSEF